MLKIPEVSGNWVPVCPLRVCDLVSQKLPFVSISRVGLIWVLSWVVWDVINFAFGFSSGVFRDYFRSLFGKLTLPPLLATQRTTDFFPGRSCALRL